MRAHPAGRGPPLLTRLLRLRLLPVLLLLAGGLHLALLAAGRPVWPCPVQTTLGVRCGGCGMTRAVLLMLEGRIAQSVALHPFALPFLLFGAAVPGILLLPAARRARLLERLERIERRFPLPALFLLAFLLYGFGRMAADFLHRPPRAPAPAAARSAPTASAPCVRRDEAGAPSPESHIR